MSASTLDPKAARQAFRDWRRSRPFWGGVTAILAGIEMYGLTAVSFKLFVIQGIAGISALLICVLMVLLAVVTWFQPQLRMVTGLTIVVLSLASILLTNLGGFLVGMLLGLHSGAGIASWKPHSDEPTTGEPPTASFALPPPTKIPPRQVGSVHDQETGAVPGASPGEDSEAGGASAERSPDGPAPRGSVRWGARGPAVTPPAAGQTPAMRRPRRTGRAQGLGIVLALLCVTLAPVPRAEAATGTATTARATGRTTASTAAPRADPFCDILPFLCPEPTPSPTPTPTPTPSPGTSGDSGIQLPSIPGITTPGTTPTPVSPSACDKARMPSRATPGTANARKAASIMQGCLDAQKAGTLKVSTTATGGGPTVVSAVPARLVASKQTMTGLGYDGVVTVQTDSGPQRALKFHADTVTIEQIKQVVPHPGATMALTAGGNVVLSGNVQLYVLSQKGKAFGLLPLTLDPDNPPPLVISFMVFTDVDSQIAYNSADKLTVPIGRIDVT